MGLKDAILPWQSIKTAVWEFFTLWCDPSHDPSKMQSASRYSHRMPGCQPRWPRWDQQAPPGPARSPWPRPCPWWTTSLRSVGKSLPRLEKKNKQTWVDTVSSDEGWRDEWRERGCFSSSTFVCSVPIMLVEPDRIGPGLGGWWQLHVGQVLCVSQVSQHVLQLRPVWSCSTRQFTGVNK